MYQNTVNQKPVAPSMLASIYNLRQQTALIIMKKAGLDMYSRVDDITGILKAMSDELQMDNTRTHEYKAKMMAEKVSLLVRPFLDDLKTKRANASVEITLAKKKMSEAIEFKDTLDLQKTMRYGDFTDDKKEFTKLIQEEYSAARLVLVDPLTRKKFGIEKDDKIYQAARQVVEQKILGKEAAEQLSGDQKIISAVDLYTDHLQGVLSKAKTQTV